MSLSLGSVKPHVKAAAEEISARFQITNIGGYRATGSVPNSDHPKGLAIDVMTVAKGNLVANWTIQNAARLGVTYIIWNRRIWQDGKWSAYSGPSPHTDHVHISFAGTGGDSSAPVADSSTGSLSGCLGALMDALGGR
jgi:hypothetical protein